MIEGVRYELQPAPTVVHQQISAAIYISLHQTCRPNGIILYAPIDVYLDEDNHFQPDIVFVAHENASIVTDVRIEGAPDPVVEILSPSTSQNDKIHKKRQYARCGVKEYWIVDPVHRTVDQWMGRDGIFVYADTFGARDTVVSPLFSCVAVDLGRVFESSAPKPGP